MPSSCVQDLQGWLSDRNCELRKRLGTWRCGVGREARQFLEPAFCSVGHVKWRRFDGREVEVIQDVFIVRRGVLNVVAVKSRELSLRNARCGLRSVRVGEASHPGLSQSDREVPDEVLDDFELELNRISDDGFLAASHPSRKERSRSLRVAQVVEHDLTRLTHIDTPSHVGQWQDGADDERLHEVHCRNVESSRVTMMAAFHPQCPALSLPTWVDRRGDESSSVHSESCWGEMEDRLNDEAVEWGFMPGPATPHSVPEATVGLGWWRRNPELLQPTSARGADWSVGVTPSCSGGQGTSSAGTFGCKLPRSDCCQRGRCQSWPISTSGGRRGRSSRPFLR